jgi:hypothetical protein
MAAAYTTVSAIYFKAEIFRGLAASITRGLTKQLIVHWQKLL